MREREEEREGLYPAPSDSSDLSDRAQRRPTRPTCPIRLTCLTRPMVSFLAMFNDIEQDSRSIPPEEITAICTAGHPPHRYCSDYPPRCGRAAAEGRGPAHREEVHLPPGICPV